MDSVIKESTVIQFIDVLIKRFNDFESKLDTVLVYTQNDARYKTEHEIDGSIFGFPFKIKNNGFDKKSLAHVQIGFKKENNNMYKIFLSNWQVIEDMPSKYKQIADKLKDITITLMGDYYEKFCENVKNGTDHALDISTYNTNINTDQYDMISEFVINKYMTNELLTRISNYNQASLVANMFYSDVEDIFVDELIKGLLEKLAPYGISASEIEYVQVTGISTTMKKLLVHFNKLGGCFDNDQRRDEVAEMLAQLCSCARNSLKMELIYHIRHKRSLPIFQEDEELDFVMDLLRDMATDSDHE